MKQGWSAHCFCCLEEEGAVRLAKCGCKCTSMFACAPCIWKVTSEQKLLEFDSVTCTVCLEFFSDEVVLTGCKHAQHSVAALPRTLEARADVESEVLETMMRMSTVEPAFEYADEVCKQYEQALGEKHGTTAHFKYLMGKVLYKTENFQGAINLFNQVVYIQEALVQQRNVEKATEEDRYRLLCMYRTKAMIAVSLFQIYEMHGKVENETESEFSEVLAGMRALVGEGHADYMGIASNLASFLAVRTMRECSGGAHDRPRTRQQHALLTRALAAVEHALETCRGVYRATNPVRRALLEDHAVLRAMESA
jgi:hypothetical protein